MPTSTHDALTIAGYTPQQPLLIRKILSTQEEGKKYTLNVSSSKESVLYQIDGCIITSGDKCDKLVLVKESDKPEKWAEIFVELKGKDASHALTQLIETIKKPIFYHPTNITKRACVVATSYPTNKSNPEFEKKVLEISKLQFQLKKLKPGQMDSI